MSSTALGAEKAIIFISDAHEKFYYNVLNNEKPKEEKEKQSGKISIKEKLAEKKEVTRQRDKAEREVPEKGTEKKSEREI